MATTAAPHRPDTAGMIHPEHESLSGPLADLMGMVRHLTERMRSIEPELTDIAVDDEVGMLDLAGFLHSVNQLGRAAAGIETSSAAAFARRDEVLNPADPFTDPRTTVRGRGFIHEECPSEIAHLLGVSEGSAFTRVTRAVGLSTRLPQTLAAVTAGQIELWQAHQVLAECSLLTDEEAQEVDAWLRPRLGRIDPTRLRGVVRYAIGRVNPDAVRERAAAATRERTVEIIPSDNPGFSQLYALIPTHHALAIKEAAWDLAKQYQAADPRLSADEARADAFVDLVLADVEVRADVTLGMPVVTSRASAVGDAHEESCDPAADKDPDDLTDEDLARRFGPERHDADEAVPVDAEAPGPADEDGPENEATKGATAQQSDASTGGTEDHGVHQPSDSRPPDRDAVDDPSANPSSGHGASPDPSYDPSPNTSPDPSPDPGREPNSFAPISPDLDYGGPGQVPDRIPEWMLDEANGVGLGCQVQGTGLLAGTFTSGVKVPGIGYIPADVIAVLLGRLDLTIARALIDAQDGTLLQTVTDAYRPNRRIRDFVVVRDGQCRMFGCSRPAWEGDIDHATAHHLGGATAPENLAGLCRFHHIAKQSRRWVYHLDPKTGVATWVCRRTGTVRETHPQTALAARNLHRRRTSQSELIDGDPDPDETEPLGPEPSGSTESSGPAEPPRSMEPSRSMEHSAPPEPPGPPAPGSPTPHAAPSWPPPPF